MRLSLTLDAIDASPSPNPTRPQPEGWATSRATRSPAVLENMLELHGSPVELHPPYEFGSPGEGQLCRSQGRNKVVRVEGEEPSSSKGVRRSIF